MLTPETFAVPTPMLTSQTLAVMSTFTPETLAVVSMLTPETLAVPVSVYTHTRDTCCTSQCLHTHKRHLL